MNWGTTDREVDGGPAALPPPRIAAPEVPGAPGEASCPQSPSQPRARPQSPPQSPPQSQSQPTELIALPEFPRPTAGLDDLGEFTGSGLSERAFLVRRGDGQVVQLTTLLYLVLTAANGQRRVADIAAEVTRAYGRRVSPDNVVHLLERRLLPLGLVDAGEVETKVVEKSKHILTLVGRRTLLPAAAVLVVARVFAPLYQRLVVVAVLAGLIAADVWFAISVDVPNSLTAVMSSPVQLLALLGITFASFLFHEIGHAAACRYGGARPGIIGFGIYLVWPALYTDVTDAYRLSRAGRLRTDLGGVYFNAIFLIGVIGLWAATGSSLLVAAILVIHLQALQQFLPIIRLDGYYILSDLAGVPDLFGRLGPVLADTAARARAGIHRSLRRTARPRARWVSEPAGPVAGPLDRRVVGLTRRARFIISAWVLVVIPLLTVTLASLLLYAPQIVATALRSCIDAVRVADAAFGDGEIVTGIAAAVSVVILALPGAIVPLLLVRFGMHGFRAARKACHAHPARRAGLMLAAALVAGALATYWVWRGI